MDSPLNNKFYSSVEQLLDKIEKMQVKESIDNDNTEKIIVALDRLTEAAARMESQRKEEMQLAAKLDTLALTMEKAFTSKGFEERPGQGVEKTLRKIIRNTKLIGQVLAIVATSVQLAVDSVGTVLHSDKSNEQPVPSSAQAKTQADLALLLQPLSALVQGLVDEKMKKEAAPEVVTAESLNEHPENGAGEEKDR